MGCDIHSLAEKRVGGKWIGLDVEAFESRNYGFFGWLAGVRNYSGLVPIAADRWLPKDASAEASKHHADWDGDAHRVRRYLGIAAPAFGPPAGS